MKDLKHASFYRLLSSKSLIFSVLVLLIAGPALPQITFDEAAEDPFGIELTPSDADLVLHALVDIDGDGDLDNFVSHREFLNPCWVVLAFEFFENQGTAGCPEFVLIEDETFGLPANTAAINFVDIDNDGDQDAFISDHCFIPTISYHENTGTASQPQFSNTPTLIMDISSWEVAFAMLDFGDLDGDGDYDALINGLRPAEFRYLENIGTPTAFEFADPVSDPFGLSIPASNSSEWSTLVDMDCDGDLDILNAHWLMGGSHNNWMLGFHENFGTPTEPVFDEGVSLERLIMPISMGDLDGDGDADILYDEYYYRNTSATNCVTWPLANYTYTQNGSTVDFTNTSTWQETTCNPVFFEWDFGDGTTSMEENPVHTFTGSGEFAVCLTVKDLAGEDQFCETMVDAPEVHPNSVFQLYPNPASDRLTLQYTTDVLLPKISLDIINAMGAVVKSIEWKNPNGSVQIDLHGLASGLYMLRVSGEHLIQVETFVKD